MSKMPPEGVSQARQRQSQNRSSRGKVVVYDRASHRQFPQYQVFLHVLANTAAISRAMAPPHDGEHSRELQPGQLVAVCLRGQEELHSFHLPVFGLVDMNTIEQFTTTRASLLRRAKSLDLASLEWELGLHDVPVTEEDLSSSDLVESLAEFTSDFAKLGDYVLGKSLMHSAYQMINEFKGFMSMPMTISPAWKPFYTSIIGTFFSGAASDWVRITSDSVLVPCLSFEWSIKRGDDGFIDHCLGYSIRTSDRGVVAMVNRHYPTRRSQGVHAMQLISREPTQKKMHCGLVTSQGGGRRFIPIPRLNSNALPEQTIKEIEQLKASLELMRTSENEGSASVVKTMEGYIARIGGRSIQPLEGAAWFSSLLMTLRGIDLREHSPTEWTAFRRALSVVSRLSTPTQGAWTGIDRNDPDLKAAFNLLWQLGNTSSLSLCGRSEDELPLGGIELLQLLGRREERKEPIIVIELDSSPSPVATPAAQISAGEHEPEQEQEDEDDDQDQGPSRSAKRPHTQTNRFDVGAAGNYSSWRETESGKRQKQSEGNSRLTRRQRRSEGIIAPARSQRRSEGNFETQIPRRRLSNRPTPRRARSEDPTAPSHERCSNFQGQQFFRETRLIIDQKTENSLKLFIEEWSKLFKRRVIAETQVASNAQLTMLIARDNTRCFPISSSKAGLANAQCKKLERAFQVAELNKAKPGVSTWFKIEAIHESWHVLDALCNEVEGIYRASSRSGVSGRVNENALQEALKTAAHAEYSKPLVELLMHLFIRIAEFRGKPSREAERTAIVPIPKRVVDSLSRFLNSGIEETESALAVEELVPEEDDSSLSSADSELDRHDETASEGSSDIAALPTRAVAFEWRATYRKEEEAGVFRQIVQEVLPQIYFPQLVTCLSSTMMRGEPATEWPERPRNWPNIKRWVSFRMDLINRLAGLQIPGTQGPVGTNIFAASILSRMIFAPGTYLPFPQRTNDDAIPSFYRYDRPYKFPSMVGENRPIVDGIKDQDTLARWARQSERVLEAVDKIVVSAAPELLALAKKYRSV